MARPTRQRCPGSEGLPPADGARSSRRAEPRLSSAARLYHSLAGLFVVWGVVVCCVVTGMFLMWLARDRPRTLLDAMFTTTDAMLAVYVVLFVALRLVQRRVAKLREAVATGSRTQDLAALVKSGSMLDDPAVAARWAVLMQTILRAGVRGGPQELDPAVWRVLERLARWRRFAPEPSILPVACEIARAFGRLDLAAELALQGLRATARVGATNPLASDVPSAERPDVGRTSTEGDYDA